MPAIKQPLLGACLSITFLAVTSCTGAGTASPRESPAPAEPVDEVWALDSARGSADRPAPLESGRYAIPFLGAAEDTPWGEVKVPAGWGHDRLRLATGPDLHPHLRRIELVTVSAVSTDPCNGSMVPVKGGVPGTVKALTGHGTLRTSEPRAVSIDGYAGQLVRFQVPRRFDAAKCWDGESLRPVGVGGGWVSVFPGWTYRVWVLDVAGEAVSILAAHGPDVTPAERAELTNMVHGLRFIDPR